MGQVTNVEKEVDEDLRRKVGRALRGWSGNMRQKIMYNHIAAFILGFEVDEAKTTAINEDVENVNSVEILNKK
jgi:hypothetical protein